MKLSVKQENFCHYYLECMGNASEAYRRAYSSDKMQDKTIWECASRLLNDSRIRARIEELQKEQQQKSGVTKDRVLSELCKVAFSNIADMHNTWIERKEFEKLSPEEKASIKSISTKIVKKNIGTQEAPEIVDVEYVKIELYDKLKAMEIINKMLGWNEPEKVENSGTMRIVVGDE